MDSRHELVRWVHLWSAQTRPGALMGTYGNFMGTSCSLWDLQISAPRNLKCWGQMCCADGRPGHRDAPRFHRDSTETQRDRSCAVRPCPSASKTTKCWKEKEVDCLPKDTGMFMVHGIFTCFRFVNSITINHRHFNQIKSIKSITCRAPQHLWWNLRSSSCDSAAAAHRLASGTHRAPSSAELQTWRRHSALVKFTAEAEAFVEILVVNHGNFVRKSSG